MFGPFIICFREGIEIFLIIIPLLVYFNKNKMFNMRKSVIGGGALGTAAAVIVAVLMFFEVTLLKGAAGDLFDGLLGIVLAFLVLYSVVLLRKSKVFNTEPNQKYISLSRKGIFIISAITFFRELLEATLFILTSSSSSPLLIIAASLLGLVCAALSVYIVSKGISQLNINVVFYTLNLFLIGLGAYYIGDGLDVLFGSYIPQIFKIGVLVYAIPCYFIMIKTDLKKYLNSNKIK